MDKKVDWFKEAKWWATKIAQGIDTIKFDCEHFPEDVQVDLLIFDQYIEQTKEYLMFAIEAAKQKRCR